MSNINRLVHPGQSQLKKFSKISCSVPWNASSPRYDTEVGTVIVGSLLHPRDGG